MEGKTIMADDPRAAPDFSEMDREFEELRAQEAARHQVLEPGQPMPNVRLFIESEFYHEERELLVHQGGQFYRWGGTCWPALEDPVLRARLYRWFDKAFYMSGGANPKPIPFAPTARKVHDLMDAARAETIVATATPVPSWFDNGGEVPADEIIACENGLIHWPSRTLFPHTPWFYVHHAVPFGFDANAPTPKRWQKFLGELWGADTDSIEVLQELFGYAISGDTRQQKMFLLVGPKRGGKGTIARVLKRLIGPHNVAGPTLASFATNFGLQDLVAKSLAIISDARIGNKSDHSIVAERLLSVTGEDTLTVDRKYLPHWTGQLPTRILMLTNELPRFTDASGALASRFIILCLTRSFYDRENPQLTEELCEELPGIFLWALDGLKRLHQRGHFQQPPASVEAMRQLMDLSSPISAFVRDRCLIDPDAEVDKDRLYKAYRDWCDERGYHKHNLSVFSRDLYAAYPLIRPMKPTTPEGERTPIYAGIKLGKL
jgi:putative DNA primase/helicase